MRGRLEYSARGLGIVFDPDMLLGLTVCVTGKPFLKRGARVFKLMADELGFRLMLRLYLSPYLNLLAASRGFLCR